MTRHVVFNNRSRGRRISVNLGPAWSSQVVPYQSGLHSETLSQIKQGLTKAIARLEQSVFA